MLMRSFFVDAGFELPSSPVLVGDAAVSCSSSFCRCCCGCFDLVHFLLRRRCSFVSYFSRFAFLRSTLLSLFRVSLSVVIMAKSNSQSQRYSENTVVIEGVLLSSEVSTVLYLSNLSSYTIATHEEKNLDDEDD